MQWEVEMKSFEKITIIGGGLAGCEAAWQAAQLGVPVDLFEMRPEKMTGAHRTGDLAELVCSNSLGSNMQNRASGLLKEELRKLGSLLISCADASSLPAGGALAVDRKAFSSCVQGNLQPHPKIRIIRNEFTSIPHSPAIIASGPLTSPSLSQSLQEFTGQDHLFFFDAIAPIVHYESINMDVAYRANRYDRGVTDQGDYINCPFTKDQYALFREALINAKRIPLRNFEEEIQSGVTAGRGNYFQGCQPIEVIAASGERSMAYGPLRPTGLTDPRTGRWPYAVVQLRQDSLAADLFNLVGFQTNLKISEQQRVFRLVPGLENATFERFGQMHRNSFIASPELLDESLAFKQTPGLFVAGQLSGIEGYAGNIASGLIAGLNACRYIKGLSPIILPRTTMTGALIHYITHVNIQDFQPMKAIFGLLPKPEKCFVLSKKERYLFYAQHALDHLDKYLGNLIV